MGAAVLPGQADPAATPGAPIAPGTPGAPAVPALPVDLQSTAPEGAVEPDGAPGAPAGGIVIPAELLATGADGEGQGKDGSKHAAPDLAQLLKAASPDGTAVAPPATAPTTAPTAAPAPTAAADTPVSATAAAPTVTPVAGQPAATPINAVPAAAGTPQLTRASVTAAAERVQDLIRIATMRNGGARALLQLNPVELGTVDVHLRTTREGLVATIAAHDQAGLDALQQAGGELRRTLEERGVQLHRLDLQLGAGQGGFGNGADARQASSGGRRGAVAADLLGDDESAEHDLSITTVTSTPAGVLVDVQA
jgi:flagellar hook-length control protein FliK